MRCAAPERVLLEVSDNGAGIDAADLERIFEPFERAGPRAARSGGLGLGLAIARKIVELHGGTIEAESSGIGCGSTLRVYLPVGSQPIESGARGGGQSDVLGLRILIVEDHASTADVLSRLLRLKGHTVESAGSIEAALALVFSKEFDLMISDVGLPDGTGFELMTQIRRSHALPAIALTGYGAAEDVRAARSAGFSAHLSKPADLDELQSAINRVVLESRAHAAT
jgi:CheY-like chemotaxis protein